MSKRSDELKIAIMDVLKYGPKSAPGVLLCLDIDGAATTMASVIHELGELLDDGYVKKDDSSSVMAIYSHANEHALSDLRARLLPHRDPVREGHEYEQHGTRNMLRYRRPTQGADLDSESG